MKPLSIFLVLSLIGFCSSQDSQSDISDVSDIKDAENPIEVKEINWTSALGKSPEEYVSTWNTVVNDISSDEETVTFFSINPDEVKWTSADKDELVYKWGDASNEDNVFILNLYIENDNVRSVQFFAPTTNDPTTTQQTKLFLLIVITLSDDQLDKDGRENILAGLGMYEEISDPNGYGGILVFNEIEYVLEPLVAGNRLVGINFFSKLILN